MLAPPPESHLLLSAARGLSDADLTAIGGTGAFMATVGLAFVAAYQARQSRKQVEASIEQSETWREITKAALRPAVFPEIHTGWIRGPNDDFDLGRREMALLYFLTNKGTGLALNIQHGVNIGDVVIASGYGARIDALQPGASAPAARDGAVRQPYELLMISVHEEEVPRHWARLPVTYWVKYKNAFGETLETRIEATPRQLRELAADQGMANGD